MAAALEMGHEPPPGTANVLWDVSEPYYRAWARLQAVRGFAGGPSGLIPQGLPYTEVVAYGRDAGYGGSYTDLMEFVDVLWALDEVYLKWWREQQS